jgi:heme-degrading monooxygenase HmoA
MYGTIARLRLQAGRENDLLEHLKIYDADVLPGAVASALYRADEGGSVYWLAVVFESKEAYRANADSPEQAERYREFRGLLEADPEWHDGEVIHRVTASG